MELVKLPLPILNTRKSGNFISLTQSWPSENPKLINLIVEIINYPFPTSRLSSTLSNILSEIMMTSRDINNILNVLL